MRITVNSVRVSHRSVVCDPLPHCSLLNDPDQDLHAALALFCLILSVVTACPKITMRFHPILSFLLSSWGASRGTAAAEDGTAVAGGGGLRGTLALAGRDDGDRSLMEMDMYGPLHCNTDVVPSISSEECLTSATPLSSIINNAVASSTKVIVPCGSCVTVDYTDSSTITLPGDGSLHIKGRLHFPPASSVTLNSTAIFIEGLLDIPQGIHDDNEVKFSLYGQDGWYYYPHEKCTYGDLNCMHKKDVGKKPVVVAGGKMIVHILVNVHRFGCISYFFCDHSSPSHPIQILFRYC